jgi:hypothetical protein
MEAQLLRLWSLHPRYLDAKGLVALWREALLAQKVLWGETSGYRHHPQLLRFKGAADPKSAIAYYLEEVRREAERRGYHFDGSKIRPCPSGERLPITSGQLKYEFSLLCSRLVSRDLKEYEDLIEELRDLSTSGIEPHPLFYVIEGKVAEWERLKAEKSRVK